MNRAIIALAEVAEAALAEFLELIEADADEGAIEEAALAVDGLALALARLPATSAAARNAKARAAARILGPIHTGAALAELTHADQALAAGIVRDAIAVTRGGRRYAQRG